MAVRGVNQNGGQVEGLSMEVSEQARPLLQAEDVRSLGDARQILKGLVAPLFVADRIPFSDIDPFQTQSATCAMAVALPDELRCKIIWSERLDLLIGRDPHAKIRVTLRN